MHFEPDHIYHVYNRGNNRIKIFFTPENYLYLLKKIRIEWKPYCNMVCYCLMPNHFHLMVQPKTEGCSFINQGGLVSHLQILSKAIGKTLSSYTQAINIQNSTIGTLFQKKTKAKCLTDNSIKLPRYKTQDYLTNCFHYIHLNPEVAGLIKNLKDWPYSSWPYSSWPDYYGFRKGTLCNKEIIMNAVGFTQLDFDITKNPITIDQKVIEQIW